METLLNILVLIKTMKEDDALTPGVIVLIAVLSLGGLVFVGYEAALVGNAIDSPYYACCSVETWRHSPTGYSQGEAILSTESCFSYEDPSQCCVRATSERADYPFKLTGAKFGMCEKLEVSYPIMVPSGFGYGN